MKMIIMYNDDNYEVTVNYFCSAPPLSKTPCKVCSNLQE